MGALTVSRSRTIARNTLLQSVGHLTGLGVAVASAALLTRYLGVRAYGTFSVLTVVLVLPVTVMNGSLDVLAVRRLAAGDDGGLGFFDSILALKLAAATCIAVPVVVVAAVAPLAGPVRLAVALLGLSIVVSGAQGTLLAVEQARMRFGLPVLVDVGGRAVTVLGVAALMLAPHPAGAAARVALVVVVGAAAALLWLAVTVSMRRRRLSPLRLRFEPEIWRSLLRTAAPLALLSALGLVNYRLDVVLLAAMKGARDVGVYALATRFVDVVLPFAAFFVAAAFPVLSSGAALPAADRQRQARRATEFLLLASLPAAVGGCVFAPTLVRLVAGTAYFDAVLPLRLLLASLPLSYLSTFLVFMLIAADEQRRIVPLMIAGIVLNLVLNAALIPRYSYVAPAVATLASEVAGAAALLVIARRVLDVRPLATSLLRSPTAAAAMLGTALAVRPLGLIPAAFASLLVYGAAVVALRVVRPGDVKLFVHGAA